MARKFNQLHGVEFVYYRVELPLGQPNTARFITSFQQYAPENNLSIRPNLAGTEAIVKAPYAIAGVQSLQVYDEAPVALMATAPWRQ